MIITRFFLRLFLRRAVAVSSCGAAAVVLLMWRSLLLLVRGTGVSSGCKLVDSGLQDDVDDNSGMEVSNTKIAL